MSKDTTDEQMKHYEKIIEQFDSVHMPAKQREIIMTEIEQLISNREKLARIDELENLPWKRIDKYGINTPYVTKKWLTERKATLRKELDREEPTHE